MFSMYLSLHFEVENSLQSSELNVFFERKCYLIGKSKVKIRNIFIFGI